MGNFRAVILCRGRRSFSNQCQLTSNMVEMVFEDTCRSKRVRTLIRVHLVNAAPSIFEGAIIRIVKYVSYNCLNKSFDTLASKCKFVNYAPMAEVRAERGRSSSLSKTQSLAKSFNENPKAVLSSVGAILSGSFHFMPSLSLFCLTCCL